MVFEADYSRSTLHKQFSSIDRICILIRYEYTRHVHILCDKQQRKRQHTSAKEKYIVIRNSRQTFYTVQKTAMKISSHIVRANDHSYKYDL